MTEDRKEAELLVTKLDAARRQLQTAVRLYFNYADPISIHALTEAAYEVLAAINRKRGGPKVLKELILDYVTPEYQKEVRDKLNEAKNFIKHAERDPDATLSFKPAQSDLLLLEAGEKYQVLTGELLPEITVFRMWFFLTSGKSFVLPEPFAEQNKKAARLMEGDPALSSRVNFFAAMLPLAYKLAPAPGGP